MEILESLSTLKVVLKSSSCIYVCIYVTNRCFESHIKKLNVFPIWYLNQLIKHVHSIKFMIKNIYLCLRLSYLVDSCSVVREAVTAWAACGSTGHIKYIIYQCITGFPRRLESVSLSTLVKIEGGFG